MKLHVATHEELLRDIAVSDDPRAAFVGSELDGCDVCADSLEELLATREVLERGGRDVRENLAQAHALDEVVGERLVDEVLGRELKAARVARPTTPAPGRMLRRWAAVLAAVAALLLAAVFLVPEPPPVDDVPVPLGAAAVELVVPVGEVLSFDTFAWETLEDGGGAAFEVRVFGGSGNERHAVATSGTLERSPWKPDGDVDAWPDEIEWELAIYDASGALADVRVARASRSRR